MYRITHIKPFLIDQDEDIKKALSAINALSPNIFLLVVDAARHLVGTITDGDIRRSLINGASLETPVRSCMNNKPYYTLDHNTPTPRKISSLGFIPQLNKHKQPIAVYVTRTPEVLIENALIMAGGFGKRLHPQTITTPKPLIPVAGKSMLERILEKFDSHNIPKTYISVHYKADQFQHFLDNDYTGITKTSLVHETEMLGTAGCISLIKDQIEKPLLVTNGDILSSLNFDSFAAYHQDNNYDATLAVTLYETQIPYGVVNTNQNEEFETITEKPTITHMVAAGIYIISKPVLNLLNENEKIDMPNLLSRAKEHGLRIGIYPFHEYWRDIGRPEDLTQAGQDLVTHNS